MTPGTADLTVRTLGECRIDSPLASLAADGPTTEHYVHEDDLVLFDDTLQMVAARGVDSAQLPGFEPTGPRRKIFFQPSKTRVGIVTCGGLCPGLNDVIRGLVRELHDHYGVKKIYGFRNGYQGFISKYGREVVELNPQTVSGINEYGGTILGTSRGEQDAEEIVDCLEHMSINVLFVIGGDGSMRGALRIADTIQERNLKIAVVGVPKTIDNDIPYIDQSFGFQTAFAKATESIRGASVEARAVPNGVGLVHVMGRHSGFIACYAALANNDADYVLIPEVPFELDGENGFLAHLRRRVERRGRAVVVAAEGAGQEWLGDSSHPGHDASGNRRLRDIGQFLRHRIADHFAEHGLEMNMKYIDPSYAIRSVPANPYDSVHCIRLAHAAVHAAMAGRTAMVVGRWRGRFVHVPISLAISKRNQVDPHGDLWMSVLEATGQPRTFG
ncbi:MAG: ATP-dependent 6-phosphofructokinase [Hamadaea sp.]|uniref:ATP-dependent 6-phosphofructokinase n=1 Tax=Hamadaea sp. TaxID=2024425 RepID=UPI0017B1DF54|nr:ATP-dependent 6-phosphofructokinase [Hamadaea sp.]NUR69579.1 ATP-dependent 6-phosphofructokinase [Hamadaea sp.]NUT20309.1 ATP-dependent 6-phosphofructokinase [Hamadaea sp.]